MPSDVTPAKRWLATVWPVVRDRIPAPPARVLEIGCGPHGGFVPRLRRSGYEAIGVDPQAPDEADYRRSAFEDVDLDGRFDALVASVSLHHVADPERVISRAASLLARGGTIAVIEWASEDFDEPTARWCFQRLSPDGGWLHRLRDDWAASAQAWDAFRRQWVEKEQLHAASALLGLLDQSFARQQVSRGAYFFPDLGETREDDELAAIGAGQIRATRIDYVGRLPS